MKIKKRHHFQNDLCICNLQDSIKYLRRSSMLFLCLYISGQAVSRNDTNCTFSPLIQKHSDVKGHRALYVTFVRCHCLLLSPTGHSMSRISVILLLSLTILILLSHTNCVHVLSDVTATHTFKDHLSCAIFSFV